MAKRLKPTRYLWLLCGAFAALMLLPASAQAYVGPGAGLTAIGTVVALLAVVFLAIVGFVWYPIKRLMGKKGAGNVSSAEPSADDKEPAQHS